MLQQETSGSPAWRTNCLRGLANPSVVTALAYDVAAPASMGSFRAHSLRVPANQAPGAVLAETEAATEAIVTWSLFHEPEFVLYTNLSMYLHVYICT
jgi:hypothetical protein